MKAEHRHDLKTNELAQIMSTIPGWAKQNLRTIIYVAIVIIVVVGYYFYYHFQTTTGTQRDQVAMTQLLSQLPQAEAQIARSQSSGDDRSYELVQIANTFGNIATSSKQDTVVAMSLIKQAEMTRAELHFRFGNISQQDLNAQIAKAKDLYSKAQTLLARTPDSSLEAAARFGQGLCEEELGNLDEAKKVYHEVSADAAFQGTTSAAAARNRLEIMDGFMQKITLKSVPRSAPVASAQSEIMPSLMPQAEANSVGEPNKVGGVNEVNTPSK